MSSPGSLPALTLLKLGGSLITDKARPNTPRQAVIARLADETALARRQQPDLRLLLGHGSGSFGHVPAKKYATRQGVHNAEEWGGFVEVWQKAAALNHLVMAALQAAEIPSLAFPPSAMLTAHDGQLAAWDVTPLRLALQAGLLPVVYGDVVFDSLRGGTIFSTEDLFDTLVPLLRPGRVLLAGLEPGVWADYPTCTRLVPQITPETYPQVAPALGGANAADVTGGMASKVRQALAWVQALPGLQARIFSAETPGSLHAALMGEALGTLVTA